MKLPSFPQVITKGNSRVTIYRQDRTKQGKGESFLVAFYEADQRRLRAFASYDAARACAEQITGSVNEGDVKTLVLKADQKAAYLRAVEALRPTGLALDVAAIQIADALARLQGRTLSEAVGYFTERMLTVKRKPVAEVVAEFLAEKEKRTKRGTPASAIYLNSLRKRLNTFTNAFQCELADVTPEQVRLWADGHEWGARTRFNALTQLRTLFSFARARGYYAKDDDVLAGIEFGKGDGGTIGIFTPDEMRRLMAAAKPEIVPFLAIGAFAGLRTAEITRLDWSKVNITKRFIEVTAKSAKTASRRIVPMTDNLAAFLTPYAKAIGPVCNLVRPEKHSGEVAGRAAKVTWKHNALRHSFISYRLAVTKNTASTALEAGNSPAMVFGHYRELVHDEQAKEWFSIMPTMTEATNVVPMVRAA
ncbi:MAG: hypothetical protein EBS05_19985 [Proteobacteria bacterium]|nr:hypothetical protein [Pseudomonadota bacterium]